MEIGIGRACALVAGLGIAAGMAGAGWLAARGMERFQVEVRSVTVKGLVERQVESDFATWSLSFRRASDSLADAHAKLSADRDAVTGFLRRAGFEDAEMESQPTRTVDRLAQDFGGGQAPRLRYVAISSVMVKTPRVALVRAATGRTADLLKGGVVLDGTEADHGHANPRYSFLKFNDLRPQLLAEATRNARATASQFAGDAGASVGRIRSAHQGNIQIFGSDGNDESGGYSATSTPSKKIRVVSTFEFELD